MTQALRRSRTGVLLLWLGVAGGCAGHRLPPPSSDVVEADFRDHIRLLASDDFEGRRPATHGEDKTVAYLVEQFKKLGLKPGNGDSYLQAVPLLESSAADPPTLTVSGRAARELRYVRDQVLWATRADAVLQHSALVFVGYGIVAPEYQWNDYATLDVRGKTVLVMVNDPGVGSRNPALFKGNAMTSYGRWQYKIDEAARHGAAAVLLLHDAAGTGFGWNAVVNTWTVPVLTADAPAAEQPLIQGWVTHEAARDLFVQAGLDFDALASAAARAGFKPVDLGLEVDATWHGSVRHVTSSNVIGVLPGNKRKREYMLYAAHWDSLGKSPSTAAVYPGAVDDAAGVAALLVLAQSLKRTDPATERSNLFAAFTAGTSGFLGSRYYVAHPTVPLDQTAAVLNLDSLHIGGPTRDVMIFDSGNSELEEYLTAAALQQGRVVHPDPKPALGYYYRSDALSFATQGVPALYARAGVDDSARGPVWGQAQIDDYLAHRFREPSDRYTADWDVRGTLDDLRLYYEIGSRVARTRRFPRWYPNSEFRAGPSPREASREDSHDVRPN